MIISGDISNIIYVDFKPLGFKQFKKGAIKDGKITDERLIIITSELSIGSNTWKQCIVTVNICVPDYKGEANLTRLTQIERMFGGLRKADKYDGTNYRYKTISTGQEYDESLKCHYVNVKILFEVINVIIK